MDQTTDSRAQITDQVIAAVRADQTPELIAEMLLTPGLGLMEHAIRRYEGNDPFPDTERELIEKCVRRALATRVAQAPAPLLKNPIGWAASFTTGCVPFAVTEVKRSRRKTSYTVHEAGTFEGLEPTRTELADEADDLIEGVHAGWRRKQKAAQLMLRMRKLPSPNLAVSSRRWLRNLLTTESGRSAAWGSLVVFEEVANGARDWSDVTVDDRLLDLWVDYTAEQAGQLVGAGQEFVLSILDGIATIPPRPTEKAVAVVKRELRSLRPGYGWGRPINRAVDAFLGEFFDARVAHHPRDKRTDAEAERDRLEAATDWVPAATVVLAMDHPLGAGVNSVEMLADSLLAAFDRMIAADG